jgi:hypothetical protein
MYETDLTELRKHKGNCLLEEYKALNTFMIHDSLGSRGIKNWCVTAWSLTVGLILQSKLQRSAALAILITILLVFWWLNAFYAFYMVFHRKRRHDVMVMINQLPNASIETLSTWKTPLDPFEGVSHRAKVATVLGSAISAPILVVYVCLLLATVGLFVLLPQ